MKNKTKNFLQKFFFGAQGVNNISDETKGLFDLQIPFSNLKNDTDDLKLLMMCKYLREENKKLKEKLPINVELIPAEYENHVDSTIKKALNFQVENDY